jgi:hypothetical protein
MLAKKRPHGIQNLGQYGRGGVIVEVNPAHVSIVFPLRDQGTATRYQHLISTLATRTLLKKTLKSS